LETADHHTDLLASFKGWDTCPLCDKHHRGPVARALAWACWKTYLDHENEGVRSSAIDHLATNLFQNERWEDALDAAKVSLVILRHCPDIFDVNSTFTFLGRLKCCYEKLGRVTELIATLREIYSETRRLYGSLDSRTWIAAGHLASQLVSHKYLHEAKKLLSSLCELQKVCDYVDEFHLKRLYAITLHCFHFYGYDDSREDLRKALEILEELVETSIRVHGEDHEITENLWQLLWGARNEQLDWSIDDLTPETRLAYDFDSQFKYSAESEEDADGAATAS